MLPVLITDLIAAYLDYQDILKISKLSWPLRKQANSVIYKQINLDLGTECGRRRASLLLRALLTNSETAGSVRRLCITGSPLINWRKDTTRCEQSVEVPLRHRTPPEIYLDLPSFTDKELELCEKAGLLRMPEASSGSKLALSMLGLGIIRLLHKHLEDLNVSSDYFRYSGFREGLKKIFDDGGFQNLRSVSLCLDVVDCGGYTRTTAVRDWDETLLLSFAAPKIDAVQVVSVVNPVVISHMQPSSTSQLVLHHCQVQESDLDGLLAATPRIRYLEYQAAVDFVWCQKHYKSRTLGLAALFNALHHVRNTLRELVTSQKFEEDSCHFEWSWANPYEPPFRLVDELSKMQCLKALTIPFASLLGWKPKDRHMFDWHELLPSSLQSLTFLEDLYENLMTDDWTDESLMPIFSDLTRWLGTCAGRDRPSEFTLQLLQMDTMFHVQTREQLVQMCQDNYVLGTMDKRLRDRVDTSSRYLPRGRGRRQFRGAGRRRGTGYD